MQQNSKDFVSTPPTNRGVVNTQNVNLFQYLYGFEPNNPLYIIFDWIQVTIFDNFGFTERDYFYNIFGISPDDVIFENKGLFTYQYTYSYKNIKMFSSDDKSLGYHFYITGQGCRNIEELGIDYKKLFKLLFKYNCKFSRVDISIDDFSNKYFNINKIAYYINNNLVRSKFKSTIHFSKTGINSKKLDGNTIWFGSRSSKIMVCFYDKLEERINNNYIINSNIKSWIRTEIRFRDLKANEVITRYAIQDQPLNDLIKGILINYIQFLIPNKNDTNKSRWLVTDWWIKFTDNIDRLKLSSLPYETSISKKKNWLDYSVSKSEFSVFISNIPDLTSDFVTSDFIYNLLLTGADKLQDKDLQFINEFRLSRGYNPLDHDDIKSFINRIKEVLLTLSDNNY